MKFLTSLPAIGALILANGELPLGIGWEVGVASLLCLLGVGFVILFGAIALRVAVDSENDRSRLIKKAVAAIERIVCAIFHH